MKNLYGILLLLCLLAPFAGAYSWLCFEKKQVRKEIKSNIIAGLDKSELTLIKITSAQSKALLHWKDAHEFEYQGQMYDVVDMQEVGDSAYYWCWWDKEETRLNRQLEQLVAGALGDNPQHNESRQRLLRFILQLYYTAPSKLPPPDCINSAPGGQVFCRVRCEYAFFLSPPPVPPPESV